MRVLFSWAEAGLDRVFPPAWNPFYHLGALGFFYLWVVTVSGIYVYVFFDTGTTEAYDSIEYMTYDQWYLAGVMRSLHRYASDGMVLMMGVHMLREFSLDRYRGKRWFTWVTGLPILWLTFIAGITGYWLVWDMLALYVAQASTQWLDWLPIFGTPIARNFLASELLDDRFFTLLTFMHIAAPLILVFILWIHLQRVSRPEINPARGLALGTLAMLLALSLIKPAESQGAADLAQIPAEVDLDWFYLFAYPIMDIWSSGALWAFLTALSLIIFVLPWMPPMRRVAVAEVDLANCNGCTRCAEDCPYSAVTMQPRSDGRPFEREAVVEPALCVSCGICAGACPTSTPFRRGDSMAPGIDLPDRRLVELRDRIEAATAGLEGPARIIVVGCDRGVRVGNLGHSQTAGFNLPCVGALSPSFVDYVISRDLADGVVLTGCADGNCFHRFGIEWTRERVAQRRDPYLRARVPRERLRLAWFGPAERTGLECAVQAFARELAALPPDLGRTLRRDAARRLEVAKVSEHG
ncbi:MAG TPA: cytochrome b N-terminal domain-containing protein [Kiloniellales bacterium]|nr:cytochrome b N-terminal domain-containing protein [Kiloniellales bacterium]